MSGGIGGDLFAIVWDAKTQKLYSLNASGRSRYAASREYFATKGLKEIPTAGPLSWSVPGCVDGWAELHKRFGHLKLKDILAATIRYADEGFPVTEVIGGYWSSAEKTLQADPDMASTYLIDGRAPKVGQLFRNPRLAQTYREIAAGGRDAYYRGRIAKEIVACSNAHDGLFAMKDFEDHT